MGKAWVPAQDSIRGKVLKVLKAAGNTGVLVGDLMRETELKKMSTLHSSIHGLRACGHRVDYAALRYTYRGDGASLSQNPRNGKMVPVCLRQYLKRKGIRSAKRVKVLPKPTVVLADAQEKREDMRSLSARVAAGNDIFIINQGTLQKALKELPADVRPSLLVMSKKVQDFNSVIRLYEDARRRYDEARRRTGDLISKVAKSS